MLRTKAMMSMFRLPFVYFLLYLDFGHIGFAIMIILLLTMNLLSFIDKFCCICMSCMLPFVYAKLCYLW